MKLKETHTFRPNLQVPVVTNTFRLNAFLLVILLSCLILGGCRTIRGQKEQPPVEDVLVHVQNNNVLDVTIYALRNTQRFRLGQLSTGKTSTFTLPGYLVASATIIQFIADPVGSDETIFIDEYTVLPGDEIDLSVPNYARRRY